MNILAMDLGKYKTVFRDYNTANAEHNFGTGRAFVRSVGVPTAKKVLQSLTSGHIYSTGECIPCYL